MSQYDKIYDYTIRSKKIGCTEDMREYNSIKELLNDLVVKIKNF
jgi:hypothetical protein